MNFRKQVIWMKRKSIIVIGIITVVLTAVILFWEFLPVKVLKNIDSEDITAIQVISSSGNQFELTEQDNISEFVRSIKQVKFQKERYCVSDRSMVSVGFS